MRGHLMRGHLQKLDTVEFTRDEYTGSVLAGKIADARVRAVLYSVFYEPTLAPNQVLDLLLFRELHESEPLKLTPFVLHVDSAVHGAAHPFQGQLELLLRRGGPQAFNFSSVPKGISKARAWGKFVEENP